MSVENSIINFFNNPFFTIVGGISTILMILGFLYTLYLIIKKVIPVWYRLGIGLSEGKIAIFSSAEVFSSLCDMFTDSKIFERKNIIHVTKDDIYKFDRANIFLVHWKDFNEKITEILSMKKDSTALVVYAPQNDGRIEDEYVNKINSHRNSIIVNFRGRLLNDILISLITISYEH